MSQAHLHQLMSEIGSLLHLGEVVEYADKNLWILGYADGQIVEAEYDASYDRLILSMEIGAPAGEGASALHQTLLQYNYLWRNTGGVRMALAGKIVVQMYELPMPAGKLDLDTLARALSGLHGNAAVWRILLAPANGDGPIDPMQASFVRV